jgi:hypothetical protein
MKNGKRKSGSENGIDTPRKLTLARTLTLTATLAALGTSLGVDVKTLFAAEPKPEAGKLSPGGEAVQIKMNEPGGATQDKWKAPPAGSLQSKTKKKSLPAVQDKMKGIPGAVQDKHAPAAVQDKMKGTPAAVQDKHAPASRAWGDPHVKGNAASGQGEPTQDGPSSFVIKGKAVPSQQMKFEGPPTGAVGTKEPGAGR